MNSATRVSAFAIAMAAVLAGGWAVGAAVGPDAATPPADVAQEHAPDAPAAGTTNGAEPALPGLAATQNGYTLVADQLRLPALASVPFRFRVTDAASAPVTRFEVEHDKRLHLVVVRRDGTNYQHVHPEMAADGTWSVPLALPAAGSYRVFADFTPEGGPKTTLGTDVHAAGDYQPAAAVTESGESRESTVDGYSVRLDGVLTAGAESTVTATVTRDGRPVTDLQPYLGAYGHLVALRASDLAYLHVHPHGGPGDGATAAGPGVAFAVTAPTPGGYRLFLDFQHEGVVRTASFTLVVGGSPQPAPDGTNDDGTDQHGGDQGGDEHGDGQGG